ncbi:hypothetical protein R50072_22470 [Simiduia litorea]
MGLSSLVLAAPDGGVVVGGSGSIDAPNEDKLTQVNQLSDLMAINWDSFNLAADEKVLFVQPSSSSLVLNRILDDNASTIRGSIDANGHVLLVNPNGVLFTETASINVGGIAVSGLDINPSDFMNGDFKLSGETGKAGSVINYGTINASSAALIGKRVENHGLIKADVISLSGADEAIVTFDSDGLIGVQISKDVLEKESGVDNAVLNSGDLEGRQVLLDASVSKDLFDAAVNNTGSIKAQGIDTSGGKIRLFGSGGAVKVSGTLDASGVALTGGLVHIEGDSSVVTGSVSVASDLDDGGRVLVLGDDVLIATTAQVDARGDTGGGDVFIGGGAAGGDPSIRNASRSVVSAGASVDASTRSTGSGGQIVLWSDDHAEIMGSFRSDGGLSGNGGLVETSGKNTLLLGGQLSTSAGVGGTVGTWLIDPSEFEIGSGATGLNYLNASDLALALQSGSVSVISNQNGNSASSILVSANVIVEDIGSKTTLTLKAVGDATDYITINAQIISSKEMDLILDSTGDVFVNNIVSLANGNFTSDALNRFENTGSINLANGNFLSTAATDFTNTATGTISLTDGAFESLTGGNFVNEGSIVLMNGDVTLDVGLGGVASTSVLGNLSANSIIVAGYSDADIFSFSTAGQAINFDGETVTTFADISNSAVSLTGANRLVTNQAELTLDSALTSVGLSKSSIDWSIDANVGGSVTGGLALSGLASLEGTALVIDNTFITEENGEFSLVADATNNAFSQQVVTSIGDGGGNSGSLALGGVAAVNSTRRLILVSGTSNSSITGDNQLTSANINFEGVAAVVGSNSSEAINAINSNVVTIVGDNSVETSAINFTEISAMNGGLLVGSSGADTFTLIADNTVSSAGIQFTSITSVSGGGVGGGEEDRVNVLANGTVNLLNDNSVAASDINFTDIQAVGGGQLIGRSTADEFIITGDKALDVAGIKFTALESVGGGDGEDTVIAQNGSTVEILGVESVLTAGLTFSDIEVVTNGNVLGTTGNDEFEITGAGLFNSASIAFSGVTSVDGRGGDDNVIAQNGSTVEILGVESVLTAGLTFTDIEIVTNGDVLGTNGNDEFEITGAGLFNSTGIAFSGVTSVDGRGGDDNVIAQNASTVEILGVESVLTAGLTFTDIETVANGNVWGTDGEDVFAITGAGLFESKGIAFSGVSAIDARGGSDSVTGGVAWSLLGAENAAASQGLNFSNIEVASGSSTTLTGSDGGDNFAVLASGVRGNGIDFTGITLVNAGTGADTAVGLSGASWSLATGTLTNNGVGFSGLESATTNTALLTGSSADDNFEIASASEIVMGGVRFTSSASDGFDQLAGGAGTDTLTLASNELITLATPTSLLINGITVSQVTDVVNGRLEGTSGADIFAVDSANLVTFSGFKFTGLASVDGGLGADLVTASSTGLNWTLDGGDYNASHDGLAFANIEQVTTDTTTLTGSSGADEFVLTGANQLTANKIAFTSTAGFTSVVGRGGSDTVTARTNESVALTSMQHAVLTDSITFTEVETVVGGNLVGSASADTFEITGDQALLANSIQFSEVSQVNAGDGDDKVIGRNGIAWNLLSNGSAENDSITFSSIRFAEGSSSVLNGSTLGDIFVQNSASEIEAGGIVFTSTAANGFTQLNGQGGADQFNASAGASLQLTGGSGFRVNNQLDVAGVTRVNNGSLIGRATGDVFTLTGSKALVSDGIQFLNLDGVDGAGGTDVVENGAAWSITATSNEAASNNLLFKNVEQVSGDGTTISKTLTGTTGTDIFTIVGAAQVLSNGVTFSGIETVNALTGSDHANGLGNSEWTLNGLNTATQNGIRFNGIESARSGATTLTGSAGSDTFVVIAPGEVQTSGITFSSSTAGGLVSVAGGEGTDSVTAQIDTLVEILAEGSIKTGNVTFTDIETVANGNVWGTDGEDVFAITGAGLFESKGIAFSGVSAIDARGGSDSVTGGVAWTLLGAENAAASQGLNFSNIEAASGSSTTLTGSDGGDNFAVLASGVRGNGIDFTGITLVNAGAGTDTSAGLSGASWSLATGTLTNNGVGFSGLESATTNTALLTGSSADDNFEIASASEIVMGGVRFTSSASDGFDQLAGGAGTDTLTLASNELITLATPTSLLINGITVGQVTDVVNGRLEGTSGADIIAVDSANLVTFSGFKFTGLASVDGGLGADLVTASSTGLNWTLDGGDYNASHDGLAFANIEQVTTDTTTLTGSSGADEFVLTGANQLTANKIAFTSTAGFTSVVGRGGSDTVTARTNESVALTSMQHAVLTDSITFTEVETVVGGNLVGSASADTFEITGDQALLANSIQFSEVSQVNAGDGDDKVIGRNGIAWNLLSNGSAENDSITFSSIRFAEGSSSVLNGSTLGDIFVQNSASEIEAGGIVFTSTAANGFTQLNGQGGADQFNASAGASLQLTGGSGFRVNNQLDVAGVTRVNNGSLIGRATGDVFTLTGSKALVSDGIQFLNLDGVDGAGGTDVVENGAAWSITATSNEAASNNLLFKNVEQVSGDGTTISKTLTGTTGTDIFTIVGAAQVLSNGVTFSGIETVNALTGSDHANGLGNSEWTLNGLNTATQNGIRFNGIESARSGATTLTGSAGSDTFVVIAPGEVQTSGITFSSSTAGGLVSVAGGEGTDSVTAQIDTLVEILAEGSIKTGNVTFTDIETVANGNVWGTDGEDVFAITGAGLFESKGIAFSGVSAIDARGGSDSVTGGVAWTLLGAENAAASQGLNFSNIEAASGSSTTLTGSDGGDNFAVLASGVRGNGIDFTGITLVNAGTGADTAVGFDNAAWTSLGTNSALNHTVSFTGIEEASALATSVSGTNGNDNIQLVTSGVIRINAVEFSSSNGAILTVNAGLGSDTLETLSDTQILLTGTDNQLIADGTTFNSIEIALSGQLVGSAITDSFIITGSQSVLANAIQFNGISQIDAGDGVDSVTTSGNSVWESVALGVARNQGITFSAIEDVYGAADTVLGSLTVDYIDLTSNSTVILNDVNYHTSNVDGFSRVDALAGADQFLNTNGWALSVTGNAGEVMVEGVLFTGLASTNNGTLIGTAGDDFVRVINVNEIEIAGINFTNVSNLDLLGGTDTVTAMTGDTWFSLGAASARTGEIDFHNIEIANGEFSQIVGTDAADLIVQTDLNNAWVNGVNFSTSAVTGISQVDAMGGADSVTLGAGAELLLAGSANRFSGLNTQFSNVESAVAGRVVGSAADDVILVNGASSISTWGITINGVTDVDAADGIDTVSSTSTWELNGSQNSSVNAGILFSNIEQASSTSAQLIGSMLADSLILNSASTLVANGITFSSTALNGFEVINLLAGDDELSVSDTYAAQLHTDNNRLNIAGVDVDGVERVSVSQIQGTDVADTFTVLGQGSLATKGIVFSGVTSLQGGDGVDRVIANDLVSLTGLDTQLNTAQMLFSGVELVTANSVIGSAAADLFTVVSSGTIQTAGLTIDSVSFIDGASGGDSFVGEAGKNWQLQAGNLLVSQDAVQISNVELLSGSGQLFGTEESDNFDLLANGNLLSHGMTFLGINDVAGGAGFDILTGATGQQWQIEGVNQLSALGVSFSSLESVSASDSVVSGLDSVADEFVLGIETQQVQGGNILFSGVSKVLAGATAGDSLIAGANTMLDLTGTDQVLLANGIVFEHLERIDGSTLVLNGTSNSDSFQLTGQSNGLAAAGMQFTGVSSVVAAEGQDLLTGTSSIDSFNFLSNGELEVGAINFSGIRLVDAAGGADLVGGAASIWSANTNNGLLVNNSFTADVGSISVLFTNIETINNAQHVNGAALSGQYLFTDIDQLQYAGVTLNGVNFLQANGVSDQIVGADVDLIWQLNAGNSLFRNDVKSVSFTGVDSLVMGAGNDSVVFDGATLTSLSTGAGRDTVQLMSGSLVGLDLGAGDDRLSVGSHSIAPADLKGGEGADVLESNVSGISWNLASTTADSSQLGNYRFAQFESLVDNSLQVSVTTIADTQLNGNGLASGGMALDVSNAELLSLTVGSTSDSAVSGSVNVNTFNLVSAGDVDIYTDVASLTINSTSPSIDVAVLAKEDLQVNAINVGTGSISLLSEGVGSLTVAPNRVNFTAANLQIGSNAQPFLSIGDQLTPVAMNVSQSVEFVGLSFVEPLYVNVIPVSASFTGDRIESVYGEQAGQGVKSAVQTAVEDFSQVDPAIFEAVSPYSASADAVATGEYRLVAGVLLPIDATAAGEDAKDDEDERRVHDTDPEAEGVTPVLIPEEAALPELKPGYSETYHIKEGDTLWDIAEKFLKDPYKWIELWKQNPKVKNPNLIYPGDVIKVIIIGGKAFLTIRAETQPDQHDPVIELASTGFRELDISSIAPAI